MLKVTQQWSLYSVHSQDDAGTVWGTILDSALSVVGPGSSSTSVSVTLTDLVERGDTPIQSPDIVRVAAFVKDVYFCVQETLSCTSCDNPVGIRPSVYPAFVISPAAAQSVINKGELCTWTQLVAEQLSSNSIIEFRCESCKRTEAHLCNSRKLLHIPDTFTIVLGRGEWNSASMSAFRVSSLCP